VLGCTLLIAGSALADVDSPLVKNGLSAYGDLDYAKAVQLLEQARGESLTREEKLVTYRTLGMAYVALGKIDEAKKDFKRLLRIDPSSTLDRSVAPKVRAIFEEAKSEVAVSGGALKTTLPTITPTLEPPAPRQGSPVVVRVDYPGGVARKMTLYFRKSGDGAFSRATVAGDGNGHFSATIPGADLQPSSLEYHIVLLDDAGAAVAGAGTLGSPLAVGVVEKKKPVYKKAWFWGVLGGVVAAGAVGTALALTLGRPNTAPIVVNPQ
jgi:tetratricopeptide (TPR) repeat protein